MPIIDPNTQIAVDGERYPAGTGPSEAAEFYEEWAGQRSGLSEEQLSALATDEELATKAPLTIPVAANTETSYTPALEDAGKLVTLSNAAAITLTLPQDSAVAFPVGTEISFIQIGAGQVTISAGSGATVNSPGPSNKFRSQYSTVTVLKRAANTWVIAGDLAAS